MNNFIYSRDRAFTVSLLSHPPLPVFPHLLHSPSLISLSLFFFGAKGTPLRNSPPCWKVPSVLLLSGGTRHEGADWSLEIGIKRTLNGDLFFIFFPSRPQIWQLLFRFHTAAATEAHQPMRLSLNSQDFYLTQF